jgi:hypothetical protein
MLQIFHQKTNRKIFKRGFRRRKFILRSQPAKGFWRVGKVKFLNFYRRKYLMEIIIVIVIARDI